MTKIALACNNFTNTLGNIELSHIDKVLSKCVIKGIDLTLILGIHIKSPYLQSLHLSEASQTVWVTKNDMKLNYHLSGPKNNIWGTENFQYVKYWIRGKHTNELNYYISLYRTKMANIVEFLQDEDKYLPIKT